MKKVVTNLAIYLPVLVCVLGAIFKITLFSSFTVEPGEPKHGGDVFVWYIFFFLLILCLLNVLGALLFAIVGPIRDLRVAAKLAAVGIVLPMLYIAIVQFAPEL